MPIDRSQDDRFGPSESSLLSEHRIIEAKGRFFARRVAGWKARSKAKKAPKGVHFRKMDPIEWRRLFQFERHSRLILKLTIFQSKAYPFTLQECRILTLLLFWHSKPFLENVRRVALSHSKIASELNMDRSDVGRACRVLSLCGFIVNIGSEKSLNLVVNPVVEQWRVSEVKRFRRWNRGV